MRSLTVGSEYKSDWNALALKEPRFALMQSWEWGAFKEKMGWQVFRIGVEEYGCLLAGAQVLIKSLPFGLTGVGYVPRGPIGAWLEDDVFTLMMAKINEVARSFNLIFLKIEPPIPPDQTIEEKLRRQKFIKSKYHSQPISTIVMDIARDELEILHSMRDSTRRKIFSSQRKGVRVCVGRGEDFGEFYRLMKITAKRCGFVAKPFEYYFQEWKTFDYYNQAGFFLAFYQETLLAAHVLYIFGQHAAFFHQVSSGEYSNLNANCLLLWEAVKWVRNQACCSYDLWGIPDNVHDETRFDDGLAENLDRTDGLWGVYKFKRGFSKSIFRFMGSFDIVYKPFLYNAAMNSLRSEKIIERAMGWWDRY